MKNKLITLLLLSAITSLSLQAQKKYIAKTAKVHFLSATPIENIEATNQAASTMIDSKTGAITVSMLIKGFVFSKALMQEHFNDKYMESTKFPKAEFKGTISNNKDIKYTTDGTYNAKVIGKLTIHGVTNNINSVATITVKSGKVSAICDFAVKPEDYKIAVGDIGAKLAKQITINVSTGNFSAL